jgi:16S rRNA (uracil1498-N3)-methyltransferase
MSPTFFASKLKPPDYLIIDDKDDVYHLSKVLRIEKGEKLQVNYDSKLYLTLVENINDKEITCKIISEISDKESKVNVFLCQSLPKKDKWELILEKCTELGVFAFIPLQTQRSIVNLTKEEFAKKHVRWNKIIRETVKQCGRNFVPRLFYVMNLEECLKLAKEEKADILVAWEGAQEDLKKVFEKGVEDKIFLFIGPEGSFSEEEIEMLKSFGGKFFNMGPRILKVDTAAIVSSALLLYEKGGLGLL